MRNAKYAVVTKDTKFPYSGCGIYYRGKTISYSSGDLKIKKAFISLVHILRIRNIRSFDRKYILNLVAEIRSLLDG